VDDRESNRNLLVRLLKHVGFETHEAVDGQTAIDGFIKWGPDVILMDMQMPGIDGCEATRRIRSMLTGNEIPILMVSASAMNESRDVALSAGVNGFIRKPFREEELFAELQRVVGVQYIYNEPKEAKTDHFVLSRASMDVLEEPLREKMRLALIGGFMDDLMQLIDSMGKKHDALAHALRELVEHYNYEKLGELLDK
jgi:CheY-like chemotaxis protein